MSRRSLWRLSYKIDHILSFARNLFTHAANRYGTVYATEGIIWHQGVGFFRY